VLGNEEHCFKEKESEKVMLEKASKIL